MKLSETENVLPVLISVRDGVVSPELNLDGLYGGGIALDKTTAAEFLPILLHFIETGEMLK